MICSASHPQREVKTRNSNSAIKLHTSLPCFFTHKHTVHYSERGVKEAAVSGGWPGSSPPVRGIICSSSGPSCRLLSAPMVFTTQRWGWRNGGWRWYIHFTGLQATVVWAQASIWTNGSGRMGKRRESTGQRTGVKCKEGVTCKRGTVWTEPSYSLYCHYQTRTQFFINLTALWQDDKNQTHEVNNAHFLRMSPRAAWECVRSVSGQSSAAVNAHK